MLKYDGVCFPPVDCAFLSIVCFLFCVIFFFTLEYNLIYQRNCFHFKTSLIFDILLNFVEETDLVEKRSCLLFGNVFISKIITLLAKIFSDVRFFFFVLAVKNLTPFLLACKVSANKCTFRLMEHPCIIVLWRPTDPSSLP